MEEAYREVLLQAASLFPPPPGIRFAYGTAGFRYSGLLLSSTVFRVGVLAALRSLKTGSVTGLMITASHNPASDNGVKVADPGGGMLTQEWEPFADAITNAINAENFVQLIDEFIKKQGILCGNAYSGVVLVARDTRPSGEELLSAAIQGIGAVKGVMAVDMGILTTPQLHWMVRSRNKGMPATESDYYMQLSSSVKILMGTSPKVQKSGPHIEGVVVDGANGVGAKKLYTLQQFLEGIEVNIRNSGREGEGGLNESVGADFVQKEKITPSGFGGDDVGKRCASLDGDADRLVYFYISSPEKKGVELIDGDKILTLFAIFIKQQLDSIYNQEKMESSPAVRLAQNPSNEECHSVTLGIVQTAYANGASTRYLRELGLEVVFTSTGVKYLHEKATEYDIGIYFEANGHGTILFSEKLLLWLNAFNEELSSASTVSEQRRAVQRLLAISSLINQAVGDALSGLLLVEVILHYMGWSIQTWNTLYQDLPSRQLKVKVADRTSIVTTDAETRVVRPLGLQEAIDSEVVKYSMGRAFVRPSGTEDVVRVYAEAMTQEEADSLGQAIAMHVRQFVGLESSM